MRDLVAALVALGLVYLSLRLVTGLYGYRRRIRQRRDSERSLGRSIIAELPGASDLVLFTEDADTFRFGNRWIDKNDITAVRVLINGAPIASYVSARAADEAPDRQPTQFEDRQEGIARDRWDVAIEGHRDTLLVECGAIRERVSQELARTVYDVVRAYLEREDDAAVTTPSPSGPAGD